MEKGVIVGSDKNQEWLLPWWWENYHKHNNLPVVFFDYGLSDEARAFCKTRGSLIPIKNEFEVDINLTPVEYKKSWQVFNGKACMDLSRSGWFKKPSACLQSPFEITLWIDLDCEVRGNINPIFSFLTKSENICLRKFVSDKDLIDQGIDVKLLNLFKPDLKEGEIIYNSGVVVFKKNSSVIQNWYDLCKKNGHLFHGDDEALSRVIHEKLHFVDPLPLEFHVLHDAEENAQTIVRHYYGMSGKLKIIEKNLEIQKNNSHS